jgi:hypothetical protein
MISMITQEQVMPLLLEACPSFTEKWEECSSVSGEEQLLYLDLAEFARHLVEMHSTNQTGEFSAVFGTVEGFHLEGNDFVKEATVIKLLEGIQQIAEHSGIDPQEFVPYLRPNSIKWWQQLNDFWEGKIRYVGETFDEA